MTSQKIIDVSEWQGVIDWLAVKNAGYHAIIRMGYGGNLDSQNDKYYFRNIAECERLNIPHGVYLYSYATTDNNIQSEIEHATKLLANGKVELQYPVYFDSEEPNTYAIANKAANRFCSAMEELGYIAGVYASRSWWINHLNSVQSSYSRWVAEWGVNKCSIPCDIWQYSSTGKVPGIKSNVDLNICYKEFILSENNTNTSIKPNLEQIAFDVIKGKYGNGIERKNKLGANYKEVQSIINMWYAKANDVIKGKYGNGEARRSKLGSDYEYVQYIVNNMLSR